MLNFIDPIYKKILFYTVKLPFIYIAIPIGFIFEYLVTFPYLILCTLDYLSQKTPPSPPDSHRPSAN